MKTKIIITILILSILLALYLLFKYDPFDLTFQEKITDVRIYRNTDGWELARAVADEDVKKIKKILEQKPELANTQDEYFGAPLIYYAVRNEKYEALKTLLEMGADPNLGAKKLNNESSLYSAAGYSAIDKEFKKDPKYVKILLEYGADPNVRHGGPYATQNSLEPGRTPLMNSTGIEKTLTLIEYGADLDMKTKTGFTALIAAMHKVEKGVAIYLILNHKVRLDEPVVFGKNVKYPVDYLREWLFPLDSEEYKTKLLVIEKFKEQGIDYWSTPIPDDMLKQIKFIYPDTWQEYIEKY